MLSLRSGVILAVIWVAGFGFAPSADAQYAVQVGAFRNLGGAQSVAEELRQQGYAVEIASDELHRVVVGPFDDRAAAEAALEKLKSEGRDAFLRTDTVATFQQSQQQQTVATGGAPAQDISPPALPATQVRESLARPNEEPPAPASATQGPTIPAASQDERARPTPPSNEVTAAATTQGAGTPEPPPATEPERALPARTPATQPPPVTAVPPAPEGAPAAERASAPEPLRQEPVQRPPAQENREPVVVAEAAPPEPPVEPARRSGAVVIPREPEPGMFAEPESGTVDISALAGAWLTHGGYGSFGGSVGSYVNSSLLVLGEFAYVPLGSASVDTAFGEISAGGRILDFGAGVQYHFPMEDSRFRPYAGGGVGIRNGSASASGPFDISAGASETQFRLHVSGGGRYYFSPRWGIRPDLKIFIGGGNVDFQIGAGVFYQLR